MVQRKLLHEISNKLALKIQTSISAVFGKRRVGYALILFEFGRQPGMTFVSDGANKSVAPLLKQIAEQLEQGGQSKIIMPGEE